MERNIITFIGRDTPRTMIHESQRRILARLLIFSFCLSKVLDRVASFPSPNVQNRATISPIPMTPFNDAVLISSLVDFNVIHQVTIALDTELDSDNPLSTPARKFVKCLGRSIKCLHTSNFILQHENEKQKAVLNNRKHNLSGKRKTIDDKHMTINEELIEVQWAEQMMDQRKEKKKITASSQYRSKMRKESNDVSKEEFDVIEDEEIEILDCIEIEM